MPVIVQISELAVRDPEGQKLFDDVHFRLHRGEWAGLIGPSRSGKTLLLALICGMTRPEHGQILVDDRNVLRLSPEKLRQLRRRMGILPECASPLGHRTLEEYVIFKLRSLEYPKEEARLKALEALELVSLEDRLQLHPQELDPAEYRLFQLALAISHDPVLLLLDDPLRDLPPGRGERFLNVLERVHRHRRVSLLMTARGAGWAEHLPVNLYVLENKQIRALHSPQPADRKIGGEAP